MTYYINGFSVSAYPSSIGIKSYKIPGTGQYVPVRSEIAPLLIGLAAEFNRTVEPIHTGWCWGYSYRAVTGGSSPSFHSAGIAIDLNAPAHPYGRRYTFNSADRTRCRALAKKYGCRWGGDYRTNPDEMHFEVILSRSSALTLAKRIQTYGTAQTVSRAVYFSKLNPGQRDSQSVRYLQRELNRQLPKHEPLGITGNYLDATQRYVKIWETHQGFDHPDTNVGKEGASRLFRDHDNVDYTIYWNR